MRSSRRILLLFLLCAAVLLAACLGSQSVATNTDMPDSGTNVRTPLVDAGTEPTDAGTGPLDAGTGSPDAGTGLSLYDDFNGAMYDITNDDTTTPNGLWKVAFVSGGFAKTVQDPSDSSNQYLVTSPPLDTLHSVRVDTTNTWTGIHGRLRARLDQQLQPPVSWYTIWPLIAFVDDTTHYYFNLKTNGWELGKKDNDLPPADEIQEYLAQGSSPAAVIGQWYTIEWWVVQDPASSNIHLRVEVNGTKVVDMLDNQPWQRNGTTDAGASSYFYNAQKHLSLYNEGSQVSWDDVYISPATTIP